MGITNYSVEWAKNIYSDYYKGPNDNATEENMEKEGVDFGFGIVVDIGTGEPPCILLRAHVGGCGHVHPRD